VSGIIQAKWGYLMNKLIGYLFNLLPSRKRIREEIARYPHRGRMVDLGCGAGHSTFYLSLVADRVIGIDSDEKKIGIASRRYPQLTFQTADASRTGYSDGYFDTAFMTMFLHKACSDDIIAEACRIAGEVVIIDYSRLLYGLRGFFISLIKKDRYKKYADTNLSPIFSGFGFSLRESRSIHPNLFIHIFARAKASHKTKVVNFVQT